MLTANGCLNMERRRRRRRRVDFQSFQLLGNAIPQCNAGD
jgi:hypothetical protein